MHTYVGSENNKIGQKLWWRLQSHFLKNWLRSLIHNINCKLVKGNKTGHWCNQLNELSTSLEWQLHKQAERLGWWTSTLHKKQTDGWPENSQGQCATSITAVQNQGYKNIPAKQQGKICHNVQYEQFYANHSWPHKLLHDTCLGRSSATQFLNISIKLTNNVTWTRFIAVNQRKFLWPANSRTNFFNAFFSSSYSISVTSPPPSL